MSILPDAGRQVKAGGVGRLDNEENNSNTFDLGSAVSRVGLKVSRSLRWLKRRRLVNTETGEILSDSEGEALTMADIAKTWYTPKGVRKQVVSMVKRVERSSEFSTGFKPVFLTLTVAPGVVGGCKERAWRVVGPELNRFLTALRQHVKRNYGAKIAYFWTLEAHPDASKPHYGWPHYHIVILGMPFIAKEKIAAWWGLGFIKVRLLDGLGGVVRYMAKYMWKAADAMTEAGLKELPEWWWYFSVFSRRRYGFSRFYQLPPLERVPSWLRREIEDAGLADCVTGAERVAGGGWRVWFFSDKDWPGAACWRRSSPWRVIEV
jgi:hypothetical protein